jgi:hypothetical protein
MARDAAKPVFTAQRREQGEHRQHAFDRAEGEETDQPRIPRFEAEIWRENQIACAEKHGEHRKAKRGDVPDIRFCHPAASPSADSHRHPAYIKHIRA